jgi:ABC-type antimicrobial peptide transport system permease subunit
VQLFLLLIVSVFAAAGTALIAIGVYGSMSFSVNAQLRSFGIRMALGASPLRTFLDVVRRVGMEAAAGITIGVIGSLLLPAISSTTFIASDRNLKAMLAAGLLVLIVIVTSVFIPALRASRSDPSRLLRDEG